MSFLGSAAFLVRIGNLGSTAVVEGSFLGQLREGWQEVRSRTWLWMDGLFSALANALTLAPIFVLGPLGRGVGGDRGLVRRPARSPAARCAPDSPGPAAVPGVVAARALQPAGRAARIPGAGRRRLHRLVSGGALPNVANTLFETALQQRVPAAAISRATSFGWLMALVLQPIGFAAVGPVAAAIGVSATLAAAAAWSVIASAIVLSVPGVGDLRSENVVTS